MRKKLNFFRIDGGVGGNQDWFTNVVMHMGGCAAAAACDTCIYLAQAFDMTNLYPFDAEKLTRQEYVAFSQMMKPYLRPRIHGVSRLWMYTEGFGNYLKSVEEHALRMHEFSGENTYKEAEIYIKKHIDCGFPVSYLMLQHTNRKKFKDFIWHWFLITGYEAQGGSLSICAVTYGEETWFDLEELWNTGSEEKGGLIGYEIISTEAGNTKV